MISPDELLASVAVFLDDCNVPYMIVGSFASNLHGLPRATYDADVVIEIDGQKMKDWILNIFDTGLPS